MCEGNIHELPITEPITELEEPFPHKSYILDNSGNLIFSEISVDDFQPAIDCAECHQSHYEEWSRSLHANSITNSFFRNCLEDIKNELGENSEKLCLQCHDPINIIAKTDSSINFSQSAISCDVCHSITKLSSGTITHPSQLVTSELFLNPGEGIKYGPKEDSEPNTYHESQYNPIFNQSDICLPCHDLRKENLEVEITFTEWNRIPGMAMSGAFPCQQCHMPEREDGTHEHHFAGVDLSYEVPPEEDPQYQDVLNLVQTSATLSFANLMGPLQDSILRDSLINFPIRIESNTGHHLPSGASFNRECWLSVEIRSENSSGLILYENGVLDHDLQLLNYFDPELTFFTSFLLTEVGDTTQDIIKAINIINYSLPGMNQRYTEYQVNINENINQIWIQAKLLFRPIKPFIFDDYPELKENIPIYTIDSVTKIIQIID